MKKPLISAIITMGMLSMALAAETAREGAKPNIIFILADDMGWGDLGVYGSEHLATPHLDRLAAQGTLFTNYYVPNPVCSPSRAGFMTGRHPSSLGIHGHFASIASNRDRGMPQFLDPSLPNVASILREVGYATAHIGKWHLRNNVAALLPAEPAEDIGQGPTPDAYGFDFVGSGEPFGANGPVDDPYYRARSSTLFVDEAIRFMRECADKPFYVQLWMLLPHATLNPTGEQLAPFRHLRAGHTNHPFPHPSALEIYAASIADMDTQIGRLLASLDELGLGENTLVFFTSDNGPEDIHIRNSRHSGVGSTGPFRGRKRSIYEGGVRVPAIVRWPGYVAPGRVDNVNVLSALDWLPTLTGILQLESPPVDGEDTSDILRGTDRVRHAPLFWEWRYAIAGEPVHHSPRFAMREGSWKLLMNSDDRRVELYDLCTDPTELHNLAGREPDIVKHMRARLLAWSRSLPAGPADPPAGQIRHHGPLSQPTLTNR